MISSLLTFLPALLPAIAAALLAAPVGVAPPRSAPALPHVEGEDYVFLDFHKQSIDGRFEINFVDLQQKIGLTVDRREEQAAIDAAAVADVVQGYVREHFSIAPLAGEPYELEFTTTGAFVLPKRSYAQYHFRIPVTALPDALEIRHSMFYEGDRVHRGLLCVEYNAKTDTTYPEEYTALVFGPDKQHQILELTGIPGIYGPREMIPQGFWQAILGLDQLLFLLALLLTTVLVLRETWTAVDGLRPALWRLALAVGVFGLAHSTALLLAAVELVALPSTLVTSIVALSILLVAVNNLTGKVREGTIWLVLVLGFFHGLSLAEQMGALPFRMGELLRIVIGFNIGVELAMASLALVLFPVLFWLRRSPTYQPIVLRGGSIALAIYAIVRLVQSVVGAI